MRVSVIIPAYQNDRGLARCLKALQQQTYPSDSFEVLVVHNCHDTGLRKWISEIPLVKEFFEPITGSYSARNCGIQHATGDILAFTDTDCIPDHLWLEKGVRALETCQNSGLVAGAVELTFQQQEPNAVELFDSLFYGFPQQRFIEQEHFGATANIFTWRWMFKELGGFQAGMKSWGDKEWGQRVHAAGYTLAYCAESVVYHPARSSLRDLLVKVRRDVGGYYDFFGREKFSGFSNEYLNDWRFTQRMLRRAHVELKGSRGTCTLRALIYLIHCYRYLQKVKMHIGAPSPRE